MAAVTAPAAFTARACGHHAWTIDVRTSELFDAWLSVLGPSACVLWQRLAREMGEGRDHFTVNDLAAYTGLMYGHVLKSLDRLERFGRVTWLMGGNVLSVEVACVPPTERQLARAMESAAKRVTT